MPNPVLMADLEARFRPLSEDEQNGARALLWDAWALATLQVPGLDAAVTSNTANVDAVVAILASAVVRVLRNPDGVKQWAVDDYSETRDSAVSAGALYLSEDELSLLGTSIGSKPRRAFSVGPTESDTRPRGRWLDDPYRFAPYGEYEGYGYRLRYDR